MKRLNMLVLDALMGQGKTSYVHQQMNYHAAQGHDEMRWLYIAPYIEELSRIRETVPALNFQLPSDPDNPKHGEVFKDFIRMVKDGENIAATHAAFKMFNDHLYDKITDHSYTLVIDETLPVIEKYHGCTKHDFAMLQDQGHLNIAEDGKISWNHELPYKGKHENVRHDCDAGVLVSMGGNILIWRFPAKFLEAFAQIWVCTYLFEGSLMSNYLKANKQEYRLLTVAKNAEDDPPIYWLEPLASLDNLSAKQELGKLIDICEDPKLNAVGSMPKPRGGHGRPKQPLSHNWFNIAMDAKPSLQGEDNGVDVLKRNLNTWFRYHAPAPSNEIMWTSFGGEADKRIRSRLKGPGFARSFVSHTAKATNKYQDRWSLAYVLNKFLDVDVANYFKANDLEAREELFALSELVQWIFRSRIRNGKPIKLYIPSARMRNLLKVWLTHSDRDIIYKRVLEKDTRRTPLKEAA